MYAVKVRYEDRSKIRPVLSAPNFLLLLIIIILYIFNIFSVKTTPLINPVLDSTKGAPNSRILLFAWYRHQNHILVIFFFFFFFFDLRFFFVRVLL